MENHSRIKIKVLTCHCSTHRKSCDQESRKKQDTCAMSDFCIEKKSRKNASANAYHIPLISSKGKFQGAKYKNPPPAHSIRPVSRWPISYEILRGIYPANNGQVEGSPVFLKHQFLLPMKSESRLPDFTLLKVRVT